MYLWRLLLWGCFKSTLAFLYNCTNAWLWVRAQCTTTSILYFSNVIMLSHHHTVPCCHVTSATLSFEQCYAIMCCAVMRPVCDTDVRVVSCYHVIGPMLPFHRTWSHCTPSSALCAIILLKQPNFLRPKSTLALELVKVDNFAWCISQWMCVLICTVAIAALACHMLLSLPNPKLKYFIDF